MSPAERRRLIAEAAERLVDVPFRLGGRDRAHGLDCVGVVVTALAACVDGPIAVPPYAMRRTHLRPFDRRAEEHGLQPASGRRAAGDILVYRVGTAQFHAAIVLDDVRIVHAHAGLRRVVSGPVPSEWALVRQWRLLT
ncbi:NlpC/P60 family protein [Croceibacterium sp. TMG7-5b_MA50]|uniref:NlpC/P60 family protein n=1 Tax=Croceibacterium sp. TMG7-5b_MA50 TaxID=3121290 RepID=UPI0032219156